MDLLPVIPHTGIGDLTLGMSPDTIRSTLQRMCKRNFPQEQTKPWTSKDLDTDGYTIRYFNDLALFIVRFCGERAVEISVNREIAPHACVALYGMDVFRTEAEALVNHMRRFSPCMHDIEDERLSYEYFFPDVDIRLWREMVFHGSLLLNKQYMSQMGHMIEEMRAYLYFDMVTVVEPTRAAPHWNEFYRSPKIF